MAEAVKYRSKEEYTVEDVEEMGMIQKKVTNSMGMTVAILTPDSFQMQFEPIPETSPPVQ